MSFAPVKIGAPGDTPGVPLYVAVRETLLRRIQAGEWGPARPVPREQDLCEEFAVSRTTVRQAVGDLVNRGLLVRKAGKGTFVREPKMFLQARRYLSFRDDLRERGVEPASRLISTRAAKPHDPILRGSPFGSSGAVHIRTLRFADGKPVLLFDHLFSPKLGNQLLRDDLADRNLSIRELVVEKHGVTFVRAAGEMSATAAGEEEASLLEVEPLTPLIRLRTQTFGAAGTVVEFSDALIRTDRYTISVFSEWS